MEAKAPRAQLSPRSEPRNTEQDINRACRWHDQARAQREAGHCARAESLATRAQKLLAKAEGPGHPDVANVLNHLAGIHLDRGRYARAERVYQRSLHIMEALAAEPADELTPEKAFERQWVLTLLEHVHARLEQECAAAGKGHLFAELKAFLAGERGEDSYAAAAERVQIPKATLKVLVHRLRKRYGELLRREIAQTVSSPQEVEEEIQALFAAVS